MVLTSILKLKCINDPTITNMQLDKSKYGINVYRLPYQIKTIPFRNNDEDYQEEEEVGAQYLSYKFLDLEVKEVEECLKRGISKDELRRIRISNAIKEGQEKSYKLFEEEMKHKLNKCIDRILNYKIFCPACRLNSFNGHLITNIVNLERYEPFSNTIKVYFEGKYRKRRKEEIIHVHNYSINIGKWYCDKGHYGTYLKCTKCPVKTCSYHFLPEFYLLDCFDENDNSIHFKLDYREIKLMNLDWEPLEYEYSEEESEESEDEQESEKKQESKYLLLPPDEITQEKLKPVI